MACFYEQVKSEGNHRFETKAQIYEAFLRDTSELAPNSIFSSEEIIESTKKEILKANNKAKYFDPNSEHESVYDLITKPHDEVFNQTQVLKGQSRLAPEYIEDNRIKEFVKDNIGEYTKKGEYSQEKLDLLKKDPIFSEYSDSELIPVLSEIESRIKIDEATKEFSNKMSDWFQMILNGDKGFNKSFNEFFDANPQIFGDSTDIEVWRNKIENSIRDISNRLEGEPLTAIHLISLPNKTGVNVKTKLNIVTINASGVVSIYDIRTSKHEYKKWDESKFLTYDWELALKRQLLGQHVDINNTRMYVIPIEFKELGNPNTLFIHSPENRTQYIKTSTSKRSDIGQIAEVLLPRKIKPKHDPKRIQNLKNTLNSLLYESYDKDIKTEFEENDLEIIMDKAREKAKQTGSFRKFNNFSTIEGLAEGWIEESTKNQTFEEAENKFRAKMALYVNHIASLEGRNVSLIKDGLISAIASQQNIKLGKDVNKRDLILNHLLVEYLNDDWEVLEGIFEASALGIIPLRNTKTGVVNLFNLSVNQFKANSNIKGMTFGDVEMLKVMHFVNEFREELLANGVYKIGEIITFNPRSGDSIYKPSMSVFSQYKKRLAGQKLDSQMKLKESDFLNTQDLTLSAVNTYFAHYIGKHREKIDGIFAILGEQQLNEISKEKLIEIRKQFLEEFPMYKEKEITDELNFDDQLEVLYALLQTAILSKEGIQTEADFQDLTKLGMEAGDFQTLLKGIYTKDQQIYTKAGKRIQGVVGGLAWTTPEWVQSKDLRQVNGLISTGNSAIGERMVKFNDNTWSITDKFYEDIKYGRVKQMIWGETQSIHSDFFIKKDGKVSKEFKTKNPYLNDVDNALDDIQRDYLKKMLIRINGFKYGLPENEIYKLDHNDYEALKNHKILGKRIESGEYFEMPLVRREELTRHKRLFTGMGEWWKTFRDSLTDLIDPRQISQHDVKNIEFVKVGFYEMFDVYGQQSRETKAKMIDENGVDYYEFNLDTIAHRVAFSKIRKQTFDLILPTVNAYMWWIKLMGGKQNKDVSNQLEYIMNQVKLAVFDEPLIKSEEETLAKGISLAKHITTIAMLAFRPALLIKELSIGTMKNFMGSALGYFQDFDEKAMTQAYTKLLTVDKQMSNEFNLIQKLNHFYRIANMDISTVAGKMQHDRHGVVRGINRLMFWTSTAGDYYNRMAIMLAKMIQDGSYDAHTYENGELKYDARKDKRFEYYLKERDKNKDKNGNYQPKKGDKKYNDQRNLYLLTMNQINQENAITGRTQYKESDLIDKAYSQKERDSVKAMSDSLYGAYDKDSQAQAPNTLLGITFMQFMTYWPSKMRLWYGKPTKGEDSAIGRYEHAYKVDSEGNAILNENGDRIYLYKDYIEHENGTIEEIIVEHETDEKLQAWVGDPQEGLFYSLAYTIQDMIAGNWDDIKNNKLRRNRALFALGDSVFILLLLAIFGAIINNLKKDNPKGTIANEPLYFADAVNRKVFNEHLLWDNTFGAIPTEPLAVGYFTGINKRLKSVFDGNMSLGKMFAYSVGAAEMFK